MLRRLTVFACLLGLAATLVHALGRPTSPIVASNGIPPAIFAPQPLGEGKQLCEALGTSVDRASALQVTVGAQGRSPALRLTVAGSSGSRVVRDYPDGVLAIPLPPGAERGGATACIRNLGPGPVLFAGASTAEDQGASVNGEPTGFSVSLRLVRFDAPDWSSVVDRTVERIGYGRGGIGTGESGWLVIALFGGAFSVALWGAWRWAR